MNKGLLLNRFTEPFALATAQSNTEYKNLMDPLINFCNDFLIPTLLTVASAVFLVLIIINGMRMARASTDEEKTKAKKALIGQVVGMIICFAGIWLVPAFVNFLQTVFEGAGVTQIGK